MTQCHEMEEWTQSSVSVNSRKMTQIFVINPVGVKQHTQSIIYIIRRFLETQIADNCLHLIQVTINNAP